jgi:hypothetical protein
MHKSKLYGFYSKMGERSGGSAVYLRPDGSEVVVSCVTDDQDGAIYAWPDRKSVGEVTKYVRPHAVGSFIDIDRPIPHGLEDNLLNVPYQKDNDAVRQWKMEFFRRMHEFHSLVTAGDQNDEAGRIGGMGND